MASSGQRMGGCGHIMVNFDMHIRCARCRDKGSGTDPCVLGQDDCSVCLLLTPKQQKQLATPTYKLRKEKKSSVLIDPSQVSVVGPVDLNQSVASAISTPSNLSIEDPSIKKELSDLKDEWSTRFAHIEALLTMGSNPLSAQPASALVFSLVMVKVTHPPPTGVRSAAPFLSHTVSSHPYHIPFWPRLVQLRAQDRKQFWSMRHQWITSSRKHLVTGQEQQPECSVLQPGPRGFASPLENLYPDWSQVVEPIFGSFCWEQISYEDLPDDQAYGLETGPQ